MFTSLECSLHTSVHFTIVWYYHLWTLDAGHCTPASSARVQSQTEPGLRPASPVTAAPGLRILGRTEDKCIRSFNEAVILNFDLQVLGIPSTKKSRIDIKPVSKISCSQILKKMVHKTSPKPKISIIVEFLRSHKHELYLPQKSRACPH